MSLRPNEKFVLSRVVDYLGGSQVARSWEGEDPPDAYIEFKETTNLLEITQLSPIIIRQNGRVETRFTQDMFGISLLGELDKNLGGLLPRGKGLIVHLKLPVENPNVFKRQLHKKIRYLITNGPYPERPITIKLGGEEVDVSALKVDSKRDKRIVGFVQSRNTSANISANAKIILEDRIKTKDKICTGLKFQGAKWLALFNQYWLADVDTYRLALAQSKIVHRFSRIFFVEDTGTVHTLK